jgi:hypothetical protein
MCCYSREIHFRERYHGNTGVLQTLAHRFRALETQLKNLMDLRDSRHKASEQVSAKQPSAVIIDDMVINNPKLVAERVRKMVTELNKKNGDDPAAISLNPENFCNALVGKAKSMVGKGDVKAVRFQIVESDGGHKVKGEVIGAPKQ